MYLRCGIFAHGADINIANINAWQPGRGVFTRWLDSHEPHFTFMFENVHGPHLYNMLVKRGYSLIQMPGTHLIKLRTK